MIKIIINSYGIFIYVSFGHSLKQYCSNTCIQTTSNNTNKQSSAGFTNNRNVKQLDIDPYSRKYFENYSRIFDSNDESKDIRNRLFPLKNKRNISK